MSGSSGLTRREFMGQVGMTAAAGALLASGVAFAEKQKRPNILWIMTDEHRTDALGCYGGPYAHSPNLDGLAQRGVVFRNAFVQSPVCVPSRASILTGKYPHTCEVLENTYHLNITSWHRKQIADAIDKMGKDGYARLLEQLKQNMDKGMAQLEEKYHTQLSPMVRSAMGSSAGIQMMMAKQLDIIGKGPQHKMFPEILAAAGFQTTTLGKLHHRAPTVGFQNELKVPEDEYSSLFGLRKEFDEEKYHIIKHPDLGVIFAGTFPAPASETPEAKWTDTAINFLKQDAKEPFLLRLSFLAPHTPVLPPEPFDTMFDPRDMKIPHPSEEELAKAPKYDMSKIRNKFTEEQQQRIAASYYGFTTFVDSQIGRLLDALAASPYADNTIVVFTADHGNLLGEHGLYQKMVFYDLATRVPLIISWPGKLPEGKQIGELVELVDFAPTLLSLAGAAVPSDMQGTDLTRLMKGKGRKPHSSVFSERYEGPHDVDWLRGEAPGTIRRMVRTNEWCMAINYPEDPSKGPDGALYSVTEDPDQVRNVYGDHKYRNVEAKLRKQIVDWVKS